MIFWRHDEDVSAVASPPVVLAAAVASGVVGRGSPRVLRTRHGGRAGPVGDHGAVREGAARVSAAPPADDGVPAAVDQPVILTFPGKPVTVLPPCKILIL